MEINLTAVFICAIVCMTIAFICYNGRKKS